MRISSVIGLLSIIFLVLTPALTQKAKHHKKTAAKVTVVYRPYEVLAAVNIMRKNPSKFLGYLNKRYGKDKIRSKLVKKINKAWGKKKSMKPLTLSTRLVELTYQTMKDKKAVSKMRKSLKKMHNSKKGRYSFNYAKKTLSKKVSLRHKTLDSFMLHLFANKIAALTQKKGMIGFSFVQYGKHMTSYQIVGVSGFVPNKGAHKVSSKMQIVLKITKNDMQRAKDYMKGLENKIYGKGGKGKKTTKKSSKKTKKTSKKGKKTTKKGKKTTKKGKKSSKKAKKGKKSKKGKKAKKGKKVSKKSVKKELAKLKKFLKKTKKAVKKAKKEVKKAKKVAKTKVHHKKKGKLHGKLTIKKNLHKSGRSDGKYNHYDYLVVYVTRHYSRKQLSALSGKQLKRKLALYGQDI